MRALSIALVAALTAVPTAVAQSQMTTPATEFAYLGDEPNVNAGGSYPYPGANTGVGYPPDANGIASARAGVTSKILDAAPTLACYVDPVHDCTLDPLTSPFTDRKFVYAWTQIRALYGTWTDVNGDAFVQNREWEQDDPLGGALAGRETHRDGADEFVGVTQADFESGTALVTYITGYNAKDTSPTCFFVRESPGAVRRSSPTSGCTGYSTGRGATPTIEYRTDSGRDGYYASLIYITGPYNDLLTTQVMETFHGKIALDSPTRQYVPVAGSPYDTDLFTSLDPTLEALYASAVGTAVSYGTQVNNTLNSVNDTVLAPTRAFLKSAGVDWEAGTEFLVGPARARVLPVMHETSDALGSNPHDYTQFWHPWIDARANFGVAAPTPKLLLSASFWEVSPTADGTPHVAPGMILYPRIMHGLWYDKNADTYIRNGVRDEPAPGCEDLTNCGSDNDPHEFAKQHHEFMGLCDPDGVDVYITPQTGGAAWGRTGVYVYGDDDADGKDDNEVDDALARGAAALVTSGTIRLWSTCNASNSPFQYFSAIRVLFPEGNPDYAIHMATEPMCTNMVVVGIDADECTRDVDVIAPWAA